MTNEQIYEEISRKLNIPKERVEYYVERYTKTLFMRIRKRDGDYESKKDFYKDTFVICPCGLAYVRYSWNKYKKLKELKYDKEHRT